ncbi:MAG: hypothetical protein JWP66_1046 [Naasia sp.]|nr:hypothetical protein [Naasia sp.]
MNELAASGPEREIFLRALREYQEGCEAPALRPECPFSVLIEPGQRGCDEECVTLLAEHDAPPPHEQVAIGSGLALTRRIPRARRGPAATDRPYDPSEEYFSDEGSGRPMHEWSTVSLMILVKENVSTGFMARSLGAPGAVRAAIEELQLRGVDADRFLRLGLGQHIADGLLISLVFSVMVEAHGVEDYAPPAIPQAWKDVFETADPTAGVHDVDGPYVQLHSSLHEHLLGWLHLASLDDVIDLIAPSPSDFTAAAPLADEDLDIHVWIADRLTKVYLGDWALSSLRLEWRYQHGQLPPPLDPQLMNMRRINENDLARYLVDASCQQEVTQAPRRVDADQFVNTALDLLRDGRRAAAAALFHTIVQSDPGNAAAANNFGFCVLPENPELALQYLIRADKFGYNSPIINIANRVLALHLLERHASALALAEQWWVERPTDEITGSVYLWDLKRLTFTEAHVTHTEPAKYIAELARRVAARTDDAAAEATWNSRIASLAADPPAV